MDSSENGPFQLADLSLQFSNEMHSKRVVKKKDLADALDAVKAPPWAEDILRPLRVAGVNILRQRPRACDISPVTYSGIKNLFPDPIVADSLWVEYWGIWSELVPKYHLFRPSTPREVREAIQKANQGRLKRLMELAAIEKSHALALDQSLFTNGMTLTLWQCSKCQLEYPTDRTTQRFNRGPAVIPKLIQKIQGESVDDTDVFREFYDQAAQMGLPHNFDKLTHGAKVKALGNSALDRTMLTRYLTLGLS